MYPSSLLPSLYSGVSAFIVLLHLALGVTVQQGLRLEVGTGVPVGAAAF